MKHLRSFFLLGTALIAARLEAMEYHIAPSGNDANPGTSTAPFATVTRARDAIRTLKSTTGLPVGGVTVWLRDGYYNLASTVVFDSRDSGAVGKPIVYAAWPNEHVSITGARALNPSWFTPVTSASPVWARLDVAAQGKVLAVDLKSRGITDFGTLKPRGYGLYANAPLELFVNGRPMGLARWPNANDPADPFTRTVTAPSNSKITYAGSRPDRWTHATDGWLHGFWAMNWADFHVPLASVNAATKTITFGSEPAHFGTLPNHPYYAYNLLEEIDEAGEYYLDRVSGILYIWPGASFSTATVQVSMMEGALMIFSSVHHVTLRDLTLEASRGALLEIASGDHVKAESCLFRNSGVYAVQITGLNNGLDRCEVVDCADDGVRILGGVRATLSPGNNYVTNSRIHRTGRVSWSGKPGVYLEGCGNLVAHNSMDEMPHAAIFFTGNNHIMEYNEIQRVCQVTSDAGAIYSGRDWGYRGNIIRFNFIHDIKTSLGAGVSAIYLDDCVSGAQVFGNILYRIADNAIECGGGRDNIITNNIFVECGAAHYNDERGVENINFVPGSSFNLLEKLALEGIKYQQGVWAAAYPECAAIPNSWAAVQTGLWRNPQGTVFSNNAGWANLSWTKEANFTGTGVFSVYASMAGNNASHAPLFFADVLQDRSKRTEFVTANLPSFERIRFHDIGPAVTEDPAPPLVVPPVPVLESAVAATQVNLQWSFTGKAGPISGFEVERRNLPDGSWVVIQSLGADAAFTSVTGLAAGTDYAFRVKATNLIGSTYSDYVVVATFPAPLIPGTPVRFEAETPLAVLADLGTKGSVGITNAVLDSGSSVRLYDLGDSIRISFNVPTAGVYRLGIRARASATLWPSGYGFKLDGGIILMAGDGSTLSALESSYGPTTWGTMYSDKLTFAAGAHAIDVTTQVEWAVVDYLEVIPLAASKIGLLHDWKKNYFSADQMDSPAVSDWSANPVGDGVANLMKYALGSNPWSKVSNHGVLVSLVGGRSRIIYARPVGLTDVNYFVEVSDDLMAWSALSQVSLGQSSGIETVQATDTAGARSFIRLRVTSGATGASTGAIQADTAAVKRIEAETSLNVIADVGAFGSVGVTDALADSGMSVRLYDIGDTVRISFPAYPGKYRVGVRVRSGGTGNASTCWPNGYAFKLNGAALTLVGDMNTLSAWEPSYGGTNWGTMYGEVTVTAEGAQFIDVISNRSWVVADYLEVTRLGAM